MQTILKRAEVFELTQQLQVGSWILLSALLNIFLPPDKRPKKTPTMCPVSIIICLTFYLLILACYFLKNTVERDCGFGDYHVFNQEFTTDKQLAHHYINLLNKNTGKVEYAHLKSLIYHTHKKAKPHSGNHIQRQKFKTRGAC